MNFEKIEQALTVVGQALLSVVEELRKQTSILENIERNGSDKKPGS